ncbi:hypothetical protein HHO41_05370 [Bacillus sp. DNRA2]|uniref:hypothetical protein n=1 Tax=Bacillus sp. DNRA2 TaxID=2723053 RepID=UPI00145E6A91|nr:hypothetical protein [Bacillus sp. DNRA2]NMD69710.1 hypothetical protein [Bacillus sp. DNRA2]
MSKKVYGKSRGSRGKVLAVKVTALFTAASIVFAPIQTSAALLGDLTKGITDTTSKVTGIVDSTLKDPVGTVTGVVKDPVGTVSTVTEPILTPVSGVVSGVVKTVDQVVPGGLQNPGGLPVSVEPQDKGAVVKTPVGNVGVLNPGVSVNTPVANVGVLNPGVSVEVLPNGQGGQGGTSGVVNATLLTNQKLTGTPTSLDSKSKKITLNYSGEGALDLGVLENIKVVFKMPDEFASLLKDPNFKKSLSASYDVPLVEVLGIRLLDRKGSFTEDQIHIDTATNSVYMNYADLLRLELLPKSVYNFKLEIALDKLPCATDNEYTFNAYTSNAFIDVSVLESQAAALNVPVTFPKGSCSKDDDNNGTNPGGNNGGNNGGTTGDQPGGNPGTGTGTAGGGLGGLLPITNTNIANIGLIGLLTLLVGMVIKMIGFKKLAE